MHKIKIIAYCFLFLISSQNLKSQNLIYSDSCRFFKTQNNEIFIEIDSSSNIFGVFNGCNSFDIQILFVGSVEIEGKQTQVLIRRNSSDNNFSILSSTKNEELSISFDSHTIDKILNLPEESLISYCYIPSSKMEQGGIFIKSKEKLIFMAQSIYNRFDRLNLQSYNDDIYFLYKKVIYKALTLLSSKN